MLTLTQSRDLVAHLAVRRNALVVEPTDAVPTILRNVLRLVGVPAAFARFDTVSRTIPAPGPTLILMADRAVASPIDYACTGGHECHHASQIATVGDAQTAVDYLLSTELRGAREGEAYAVGLGMRWLLTGFEPTVEEAMASLGGGLYHLPPEDLELARGVVTSAVETMRGGLLPPYQVLIDAERWLRERGIATVIP